VREETPTVLIHSDRPDIAANVIRIGHPDLSLVACDSYAELPAVLADSAASVVYSIRFAGTPQFPRTALVENAQVRWVSVGGSGTDHLGRWDPARVTVTNSAGVAADMMAEYALGAMLHFSLNFDAFRAAQARRDWIAGRVAPIAGRTVVIVGLGRTGRAAAQRFKAMGMRVLGLRARPAPTEAVDEVHALDALPSLLTQADFILVCVPLLPETRGIIDEQALAALKPGAVLVDVSRGGVTDEAALQAALADGRLKGAALDVFASEPLPATHPFWGMPNVLITPHCSSVYEGWEERAAAMFAENLGRYRKGLPLTNVVDPARGY